jgi:hypothetical protein
MEERAHLAAVVAAACAALASALRVASSTCAHQPRHHATTSRQNAEIETNGRFVSQGCVHSGAGLARRQAARDRRQATTRQAHGDVAKLLTPC